MVTMSPWRRSTTLRARRASDSASIVDRSSPPDEGAADGQPRQDPTYRPADAWRTPCHVGSRPDFRCFDRGGGGGVGDDGPLVRLWPIRRQLRKCHDRKFDGRRSRACMWCRSTRLVSRCLRPARRPLGSSSGSVSNRGVSAIAATRRISPTGCPCRNLELTLNHLTETQRREKLPTLRMAPRQRPKGGPR